MSDVSEEIKVINNMEIHTDHVLVSVNPKIFPMEIIRGASYIVTDEAYVVISGNPNEEIIVELRPKKNQDLETLGREFNNELLNYYVYVDQSKRNRSLREMIMKRAVLTNVKTESPVKEEGEKNE
ncbi:MAG: hypothetical protein J7J92_02440 [Candidatus Aenigmarchaeota archaeon]|nr:hypothetical protein [Candidatus Aenigmarchaeota archaeon]